MSILLTTAASAAMALTLRSEVDNSLVKAYPLHETEKGIQFEDLSRKPFTEACSEAGVPTVGEYPYGLTFRAERMDGDTFYLSYRLTSAEEPTEQGAPIGMCQLQHVGGSINDVDIMGVKLNSAETLVLGGGYYGGYKVVVSIEPMKVLAAADTKTRYGGIVVMKVQEDSLSESGRGQ